MDPITLYHSAIEAVVTATGASRLLLHVHAGMLIYLGCQLLLGTRRGSLVAVIVTIQLAFFHEVMNRLFYGSWRWHDTSTDLLLTMFWPVMCYAVSRFRRWRWSHRIRVSEHKKLERERAARGAVAYG